MPRAPRGKRVLDAVSGSYTVVGRAPNGEAEPYFDRSRGVWVAPWRKPDGKVGRPTGKTRAAAVASRNRHIAAAEEAARCGPLAEGFSVTTTHDFLEEWIGSVQNRSLADLVVLGDGRSTTDIARQIASDVRPDPI